MFDQEPAAFQAIQRGDIKAGDIVIIRYEGPVGGPLALVREGDTIELDVEARRLHLDVTDEEMKKRRSAWKPVPNEQFNRGYARLYVDHVLQADQGADFDFLVGKSGSVVTRDSH